jgi:hypothetical protein
MTQLSGCIPPLHQFLANTMRGMTRQGALDGINQSSLISQGDELIDGLLQWDKSTFTLGGRIIAITDVKRASFLLLGTNNYQKSAPAAAQINIGYYSPNTKLYCSS